MFNMIKTIQLMRIVFICKCSSRDHTFYFHEMDNFKYEIRTNMNEAFMDYIQLYMHAKTVLYSVQHEIKTCITLYTI